LTNFDPNPDINDPSISIEGVSRFDPGFNGGILFHELLHLSDHANTDAHNGGDISDEVYGCHAICSGSSAQSYLSRESCMNCSTAENNPITPEAERLCSHFQGVSLVSPMHRVRKNSADLLNCRWGRDLQTKEASCRIVRIRARCEESEPLEVCFARNSESTQTLLRAALDAAAPGDFDQYLESWALQKHVQMNNNRLTVENTFPPSERVNRLESIIARVILLSCNSQGQVGDAHTLLRTSASPIRQALVNRILENHPSCEQIYRNYPMASP
jgi:hypothetical protein